MTHHQGLTQSWHTGSVMNMTMSYGIQRVWVRLRILTKIKELVRMASQNNTDVPPIAKQVRDLFVWVAMARSSNPQQVLYTRNPDTSVVLLPALMQHQHLLPFSKDLQH